MLTSSDSVKSRHSRYRVDSACRGAHIVKSAHILNTIADTSAWKKLPLVQGITGNKLGTTGVGTLANIGGTALVVPEATDNLLSLMEIVKANKGFFSGDSNSLTIRDSNDNTIIKAYNFGDDFWSCTDDDLAPTAIAFDSDVVDTIEKEYHSDHPVLPQSIPHFSAEERTRARQAYELCAPLRHPGDAQVIDALNNGSFASCHLTAQDF